MQPQQRYAESGGRHPLYIYLVSVLLILLLVGIGAAHQMDSEGHQITGMNNQIVWGLPHVFALFLIVSASGALNLASLGSLFGFEEYKPLSRLSLVLAIALLLGGLSILLLDLGRPDRLIVAITYYNFSSIFAWNIILYLGFIGIALAYLWLSMERRMHRWVRPVARLALLWRLILTSGSGLIFGVLAARAAYDSWLMAPLFIVMSLAFGLAIFILVLLASFSMEGRLIDDGLLIRLRRMLGKLVLLVAVCVLLFGLFKFTFSDQHGVLVFLLQQGGIYPLLFWGVQVGCGYLLASVLIFTPALAANRSSLILACLLVIFGALAQFYVIIIGGQAYPLDMFPGYQLSSRFFDGVIASYSPSLREIALGLGGISLSLLVTLIGARVLPILPEILHYQSDSR